MPTLRFTPHRSDKQGRLLSALLAWIALTTGAAAAEKAVVRPRDLVLAPGDPLNRRTLAQQQPVFPIPYDSEPGFIDGGDAGFMAWHSFAPGAERIVGRPFRGAADVPFVDLAGSGVFTPPELAAKQGGTLAVAWSALNNGRWSVIARRRPGDRWTDAVTLSAQNLDALHPALEALDRDNFAIGWTQWNGTHFELVWARWDAKGVGATMRLSDPDTDAFRLQFVAGEGGRLDAVWDAYGGKTSRVYARQLLPNLGPIETVSQSSDRCLKPSATRALDGKLIVAWIRATDVIAAAGTIDQLHAIEMAERGASSWQPLVNEKGGTEVAWLTLGLLAQIEPKPVATGGYMGRRRDPMFVRDGTSTWLIWERKALQLGSTAMVTGELLGRQISGGSVGPTQLLSKGAVDYHVAHGAQAKDGRFTVLVSSLPREGQRNYTTATVNLADAQPATTEPWPGWKRVELPLAEAAPRRHTLREGGREFQLYWMDSHVHSGLSADAEGEPDEILLYARDRGRLDAVVMQENDFYNFPLTDYEYQLGAFYSRVLSSPRFLALPGYEWTQRLPTDRKLAIDQPRFWSSHFSNHRTVIYPRAGGPLVRYVDVGNNIERLYEAVARHGGVMHTQHAEFDFKGVPVEVAMEVTAGWGIYFLNPGKIHETLKQGFRAGFIGTSDSHRRNPGLGGGLTGIYAAELTPEAIIEAYRARRVFATSGARIAVEARANGVLMGQETSVRADARLTLVAHGSRPIRQVTLIRDGENLKVFKLAGDGSSAELEYEEKVTVPGTHWYYWRVEQEGVSQHYGGNVSTAFGNLAWSTPHWVKFQP
jgi:hypothetical protein